MMLEAAETEAQAKIAEITLAQRDSDLERAVRCLPVATRRRCEVTNARSPANRRPPSWRALGSGGSAAANRAV